MTTSAMPSMSPIALAARVSAVAARVVVMLLAVFHVGLLVLHVQDGRLFDPATSLRWVIGGLLIAGFIALRRMGASVLWGRKAVVLWLLVVVLHWYAAPAAPEEVSTSTVPAVVSSLATAAAGVIAAVAFLLIVIAGRIRRVRPVARPLAYESGFALCVCGGHFFSPLSPRPPPAA